MNRTNFKLYHLEPLKGDKERVRIADFCEMEIVKANDTVLCFVGLGDTNIQFNSFKVTNWVDILFKLQHILIFV